MPIPDLDPRAIQGMMKMGGKKKLDTLIQMLQDHAPVRLKELAAATALSEAQAAARVLKTSASHLGLGSLEDCCDQVLESASWSPGSPLAAEAAAAYQRGLAALTALRQTL
jgi:hypothetical protein